MSARQEWIPATPPQPPVVMVPVTIHHGSPFWRAAPLGNVQDATG